MHSKIYDGNWSKPIEFVDLRVIRQTRRLENQNWLYKEMGSGRYLNCNSSLPFLYKRNTIKILTDKIILLSDAEFNEQSFELMKLKFTGLLTNNLRIDLNSQITILPHK